MAVTLSECDFLPEGDFFTSPAHVVELIGDAIVAQTTKVTEIKAIAEDFSYIADRPEDLFALSSAVETLLREAGVAREPEREVRHEAF